MADSGKAPLNQHDEQNPVGAVEDVIASELAGESDSGDAIPSLRQIGKSFVIVLAAMVAVGLLLTLIGNELKQFSQLPNMGQVMVDKEGNEFFAAQYQHMRRFALPGEGDMFMTETNRLKEAGLIGRAMYMYTIINTINWALEFRLSYLGGMVLIPFFVLAAGISVFYFVFLPHRARTQDSAIFFAIAFSSAHAAVVIAIMTFLNLISSNMGAMYQYPVLGYSGQMIGYVLPGAFVLLLTNVFYGAVIGTGLGLFREVARFFSVLGAALGGSRKKARSA